MTAAPPQVRHTRGLIVVIILAIIFLALIAALVATLIPARRAIAVEPATALKND